MAPANCLGFVVEDQPESIQTQLLEEHTVDDMLTCQGTGGFRLDASVRIPGPDPAGAAPPLLARPPFALDRLASVAPPTPPVHVGPGRRGRTVPQPDLEPFGERHAVSTFEYLAVLFSVVVGLAVAQTLQGLLRVVRHWRTVRIYWPALIWTAAVMQWTIIFWWFSGSGLGGLSEWQFPGLLFVLAYGSALFFLLGLLYPDDMGATFDMRAHFREVRPWFFGIFLGLGLLELTDTYLKGLQGTSAIGESGAAEYLGFMAVWIGGALVCLRTRDGRVMSAVGTLFLFASFYVAYRYGWAMGADLELV